MNANTPLTATAPTPSKIIGYIRVSTAKQGQSGLGLEGQTAAIVAHAQRNNGTIIAQYCDVESGSGKHNDRPELAKAIAHARRIKGRLVIAKLDRLARNVHFISGLLESKVDFVACDNPTANKLTIHILAAIAEQELEMISQRTKAALQAAKARGTLLGSSRPNHWNGREALRLKAAAKATQAALVAHATVSAPLYSEVRPIIDSMKATGASLQAIADALSFMVNAVYSVSPNSLAAASAASAASLVG